MTMKFLLSNLKGWHVQIFLMHAEKELKTISRKGLVFLIALIVLELGPASIFVIVRACPPHCCVRCVGADRQAQQDSHIDIHQLYPINFANTHHINNNKF